MSNDSSDTTNYTLLRKSYDIQKLDSILILRLISELEGVCRFLDHIDKEDFEIVSNLRSKYYKMYFRLSKLEKEEKNANLSRHE
jgi:hypothetical protein